MRREQARKNQENILYEASKKISSRKESSLTRILLACNTYNYEISCSKCVRVRICTAITSCNSSRCNTHSLRRDINTQV